MSTPKHHFTLPADALERICEGRMFTDIRPHALAAAVRPGDLLAYSTPEGDTLTLECIGVEIAGGLDALLQQLAQHKANLELDAPAKLRDLLTARYPGHSVNGGWVALHFVKINPRKSQV